MYFGFLCKNLDEYWHLTGALLSGMTVFLIVSFCNIQMGRIFVLTCQEGNLFVQAVRILYWIDTPTNILPSLHVYNAVACCTAICTSQDLKNRRKLVLGTKFLTIMIVLSTMFIKQHSFVDVSMALILYAFCYQLFYKGIPQYRKKVVTT